MGGGGRCSHANHGEKEERRVERKASSEKKPGKRYSKAIQRFNDSMQKSDKDRPQEIFNLPTTLQVVRIVNRRQGTQDSRMGEGGELESCLKTPFYPHTNSYR